MNIFVYHDGEVCGPFSRPEIFALLAKGSFSIEEAACLEGSDDWHLLRELLAGRMGVGAAKDPPPESYNPTPIGTLGVEGELMPPGAMPAQAAEASPWQMHTLPGLKNESKKSLVAAKFKNCCATIAAFLLVFCVAAATTFFVGRTKFESSPDIVTIKTTRVSTAQRTIPRVDATTSDLPATSNGDAHRSAAADNIPGGSTSVQIIAQDQAGSFGPTGTQGPQLEQNDDMKTSKSLIAPHGSTSTTHPSSNYQKINFEPNRQRTLFDTPIIAPQELVSVLEERFSTTPTNAAGVAMRADPNITVREGSFMLPTSLKWNPRVEVVYSIPLYRNVTPSPNAANMVMLGFYPNAMAPPKPTIINGVQVPGKSQLQGALNHYAREYGFTAFSMHIVTRAFNDPEETYFLAGQEWTNVVFRAQDELTRMFRLPPRKLMLEGMSLGGTFVEEIAAARPDRVAAVAFHSAPEIAIPKEHSNTLWYMQITRGDSMQAAYNDLYDGLSKVDDNVLFDILPPNYGNRGVGNLYHSESQLAKNAADAFLEGVAKQRDSAGNIDPQRWPYARRKLNPINILSKNSPSFAQMPPRDREFLPSEQFVRCVQALPLRVQSMVLPTSEGRTVKCFVGLPALGRARGVLIYTPESGYSGITNLFDNMYYFAEKGYIVLCPSSTQSAAQAALTATLRFEQSVGILKGVPLVFVGAGEMAPHLWETISKSAVDPKAIALIDFKPQGVFDESRLPVGAHPIRCPVFFIEEEKEMMSVSTASNAWDVLDDAQKVDAYVALSRERHQLARIVLIPDSQRSKTYDEQKAVEAVNDAFADVVDGHKGLIGK